MYWFYRANWTEKPMLHLCSKRMSATTNGVFDVVAFTNAKSPVEVLANGRKVLESLPDEIASVTARGVPLEMGVNRIEVVCGTLRDKMEITRK